jgi:CheY-like chemotaxis protein/DNA-binding CsgD family transcriptional regulator
VTTRQPSATPATSLLCVDDDAAARLTVTALLRPLGLAVRAVASGDEALAVLDAAPIDLVVCDVMMPGMDGFAVCRAIKTHPRWRYIPVILLTALDADEDLVRGLEAGADDFATKPVDGAVLRAKAQAMLRVRAQYQALGEPPPPPPLPLPVERGDRANQRARTIEAAGLTAREREVLELLLLGRSHPEIAIVLEISERTSKFHQANVLRKLGAESRMDLLRLFV